MLKRTLVLLVLSLAQTGCSVEEGVGPYKPTTLTTENREQLEGLKREYLRIEDIRVGDGPLAAWSRRIKANIVVRYTDGTIIYEGSMFDNVGFEGSVFLLNANQTAGALAAEQTGVWLGLNGMAVGGKRKITIQPKLVYGGPFIHGVPGYVGADVRKDTLIVEATLTASCVPTLMRAIHLPTSRYMVEQEVGCREHAEPRRTPNDPIWKIY
ncbi:MAG: FKBP-type peptidyl-prolyl cis-trans isomerase [Anaerolineae bacterium]|nr:FKBP-type peptidyl-prolyl cis-trans isomerase [Anaerolineae bacterium]